MLTPLSMLVAALALPAAYTNGLHLPDLGARALDAESLLADPDTLAELAASPNAHTFLKYVIECALPPEAAITVPVGPTPDDVETFHGALGLAPEWGTGPCGEACQEWVSACLLSRANAYAVPFELTGRGDNPGLPNEADPEFTVEEGAFYGNMFLPLPEEYACRGTGDDPLALAFRACTLPGSRCGVAVVGDCGPVDAAGRPTQRHACEGRDPDDRYYLACHRRASLPGAETFPDDDRVYRRVITTWLRPTTFRHAPTQAACDDAPEPATFPPLDDTPARAGDRCENEDACDDPELTCLVAAPGGLCTRPCTNSGDAALEAEECGPGATCLAFPGGQPLCTAACTPNVPGGDCPAGRVCTLPWNVIPADAPRLTGCMPFCSTDADCNPGSRCHAANGGCLSGALPEGAADGEPCDPRVPGACSGLCFAAGPEPGEGLCGSLFNAALSDRCPTPGILPYGPRQADDLGLCMFKVCHEDADCTPPLRCGQTQAGRACTWR